MTVKQLRILSVVLAGAPLLHAAGSITVGPVNESTAVGTTRQFTAAVTGLANPAVTWYVNGAINSMTYGSIDGMGLYTAPATVPANPVVTIQAVSMMDPTVIGSTTTTIRSMGPVLTSTAPASVNSGAFSFTLNGSGFQPGAVVVLNATSLAATYVSSTQLTVAGVINITGYVQVRAQNPGSVFSNMISILFTSSSSSPLTVTPSPAAVVQGLTQQFTAVLNGAPQNVSWTVNGLFPGNATTGTITASGLFTAPASIPSPATVTIAAKASNNTTASGTVTIANNQPPAIGQVNPSPVPVGVFSLSITGTNFTNGTQSNLGGTPLVTQYLSPTQIIASGFTTLSGPMNLVVANGPILSQPFPLQVGVGNPMVTASAARRFLQQAAFGPTPADAAHVQQVGFQGWLNEQFAMPAISNFQGLNGVMAPHFLTNAVTQPDQLRQRVAFALSQIFVTSLVRSIWSTVEGPYQDMLLNEAFLNYRHLLQDVTLHATMGLYLDMANNGKANAAGTILPNENYAREVLQLFSVGTFQLNPDGTPMLDAQGHRIPTYNQTTIAEFARVFTGWTNAPSPNQAIHWGAYVNVTAPMVPYAPMHDTGAKTLLNGAVVAAGGSPQQDLTAALDNIFNHPNVGPFISKQLIQHLVKSNPSPAYVARVAAAFNGTNPPGPRGDLKAVVTAILLDPEARANDNGLATQANDGHMQEPVLFLAGLLRGFNASVNDQSYFALDLATMGQDIYNSPSVFNYYSPNYVIPGVGVTGGEFQIYTPYTAVYRANIASGLFSAYNTPIQTNGPGTTIDLTAFVNLANNPSLLVDALDFTLTNGLMPTAMKQILSAAVAQEAGGSIRRVQTAIYLILQSGYYNVWN